MRRQTERRRLSPEPAAPGLDSEAARAAILEAIARIPAGRVATYGQIAWVAGLPGRARLVGRVLGSGLDSAEANWHRVINARGEISLPVFSPSHREQKRRLRAEGVIFTGGRISLRRYGWHAGDASPLID